jgi:hypothetical protein
MLYFFNPFRSSMSSLPDEIRARVFAGSVPISFSIPSHSFPICVNVPRSLSPGQYLYRHYSSLLPPDTSSLWLSIGRQPIKWHFPAGVLYSAYGPPFATDSLSISVNFEDFVASKMLRCDSLNTAAAFFCHSFKEATFTATQSLEFLDSNRDIAQRIEGSAADGDFNAFTAAFGPWLAQTNEWKRWPIRVLVKAEERLVFAGVVREEGATVGAALLRAGIQAQETVDIQGIQIRADASLEEVFPLLVNADGWLYIVP